MELFLVAAVDDLVEQIRGVVVVGEVADLVDDRADVGEAYLVSLRRKVVWATSARRSSRSSAAVTKRTEWPARAAW